jgi:hypothetical protein
MWVARSFIDFVHPQDRATFISQVTENICLTLRDSQSEAGHSSGHPRREYYAKSGSFFCRIRVYNSLKSGFTVKERKTRFTPFKLSVCFKGQCHEMNNFFLFEALEIKSLLSV